MFWMDNLTAVSYILNEGGTRSRSMMLTARDLFRQANLLNVSISAKYIPGALNAVADMCSRRGQTLKAEWRLSETTFRWIRQNKFFGDPQINLFANKYNKHLERYGSPCPDPTAEIIDALAAPWPKTILFAFPPTSILEKVMVKIQQERPQALILVAPLYPRAAWFPFLSKWAHSKMEIPLSVLQLHQPHFNQAHPNPGMLCLTVYHIRY
jgi:hypothetical protein